MTKIAAAVHPRLRLGFGTQAYFTTLTLGSAGFDAMTHLPLELELRRGIFPTFQVPDLRARLRARPTWKASGSRRSPRRSSATATAS